MPSSDNDSPLKNPAPRPPRLRLPKPPLSVAAPSVVADRVRPPRKERMLVSSAVGWVRVAVIPASAMDSAVSSAFSTGAGRGDDGDGDGDGEDDAEDGCAAPFVAPAFPRRRGAEDRGDMLGDDTSVPSGNNGSLFPRRRA